MNNIRKYFKLILLVLIILIVSIVAPKMIFANDDEMIQDTSIVDVIDEEEEELVTSLITSAVYDGQGGLTDLTGASFVITWSEFAYNNTWYLLCNELGAEFVEVRTLYTLVSENIADPEEAYILSDLENYNYKGHYRRSKGQWAWWSRGSNASVYSSDTLYLEELNMSFTDEGIDEISSLITSGEITGSESEVKEAIEEIISNYGSATASDANIDELYSILLNIYEDYGIGVASGAALSQEALAFKDYILSNTTSNAMISYTIEGITVQAYELEMETKLYYEDATVSFSEEDNAYIIGPFQLSYPEYGYIAYSGYALVDGELITYEEYLYTSGKDLSEIYGGTSYSNYEFIITDETYIMFSGLDPDGLTLETNLGEMQYYTADSGEEGDWTIAYTNESMIDINGLPKSITTSGVTGEFYIVLNYKIGITEITKLEFTLQYMNAGGYWNLYEGQMKYCPETGEYYDYDQECTFTIYYCDEELDCEGHYICDMCGAEDVSESHDCLIIKHSQNMAVLDRAVRWYTYKKITWEGKKYNRGSITITKKTVNENGDLVDVNDTFFFDIYVDYQDGEGEKLFETVAVSTVNGLGSKTTTSIYWEESDGAVPTYRVVEQSEDGYSITNNEVTGSIVANETIEIEFENVVEPYKGRIEIDKLLINATEALEQEKFEFTIYVWGEFKYAGGSLATYTAESPYEITAEITGSDTWISDLFEWYGDAPQYKIVETVEDTSDFELVSSNDKTGTISSNDSTVEDGDMINSVVMFVNKPRDKSQIIINKELVDGSTPDSGDAFTVVVTITGDFIYVDSEGNQERYSGGSYSEEVVLDASNDWSWESGTIYWTSKTAPTYTIEETGMPDNYKFERIESGSGSLDTYKNIIYIYNEKKVPNEGSIQIEKILETDGNELIDDSFSYEIEVTGNFTYGGTEYTDGNSLKIEGTISVGESVLYESFSWDEDEDAPTYTVTETGLDDREDVSFVSISNGESIVTNATKISGTLAENDTVIVTMRNREAEITEPTEVRLQIKKNVTGNTDYLNTLSASFTFEVELTGTFTYTADDGTVTTIEDDTLTIDNIQIDDVLSGDGTWTSGVIEWDSNVYTAPTYRITEVDIPEWAEFISWTGRTSMASTTFISGTLTDDTINIFICNNEITVIPQYGKIIIEKILLSELIEESEEFNFTITVTGDFTYDGTAYTSLVIEDVASAETPWESRLFYWETDEAPTYIITENLTEEQIEDEIEVGGFANSSQSTTTKTITGSLFGSEDSSDVGVAKVIAKNNKEPKIEQGRIQITKEYVDANGNEIDGIEFNFEITITYADGTSITIPVSIESGTTWRSDYFYWESTEDAPTYEVVETSTGYYTSEIIYPEPEDSEDSESSGDSEDSAYRLEADSIIKITARNEGTTPNQGQISITKYIEDTDKVSILDYNGTFSFVVTIKGTFTYTNDSGTVIVVDDTLALDVTINISGEASATWTSGTIEWYGDEAPRYSVEETNVPTSWWLHEMENSSGSLVAGGVTQVTVTDQTDELVVIVVTMEMGGKVWNDTDYSAGKEVDVGENGVIDDGEAGIEGVKVTITRVVTDSSGNIIATLEPLYTYNENDNLTPIDNFTYTDSDGNWLFGSISVPAFNLDDATEKSYYEAGYDISYDVTFTYDGQTYEPTIYLATSDGDASAYMNASTSERDNWLNDSMAVDDTEERQAFNAKFENIEGQDPIQSDGTTVGKATGSEGDITLNYKSRDAISTVNSDNTRKVSILQTTDENGDIYEDFLIEASTSTNGLTYPFDNEYHLVNWDKSVDPLTGLSKTSYNFSATYNYMLSINLGLVEREAADIALEKDLTEAIVVINGKVLKYTFNTAIDLENPDYVDFLYQQIAVADEEIEYTLGLYSSDYYYRASIYDSDSELSSALDGFYGSILSVSTAEATELQIYLKYTINVYNESETYDVRINQIADYYDSTFTLITNAEDSATYVQTINGKEVNEVVYLAEASTVTYYSASNEAEGDPEPVIWSDITDTLTGSNNITYNKITTTSLADNDRKLSSGQRAEIQLTFKVNKDTSTDGYDIADSIILGQKHNIAEVTSFSTYYSDNSNNRWSSAGELAGRVDEDSAPDNVNIPENNEKSWYEDDTDSSPILVIELYDEDREVNGLVWEDARTNTVQYSQILGDGIFNPDQGDKVIADLTTEIIEVITIPDTSGEGAVYTEYEFIWPTEDTSILNGYSLEEVTGFDSTIVTNSEGVYAFTAVPAGNYKVRFVYGDKEIATGNVGYEEIYNGQDYKSTAYQIGFDNDTDGDGYTDNAWHDLSNSDLNATRVSDARDVEARRLVVSSKSEILQYDNTSVLATADDISANHDELFGNTVNGGDGINYEDSKETDAGPVYGDGYYMYAETAKLNLEVENIYEIDYTTETIGTLEEAYSVVGDIEKGSISSGNEFEFYIDNIDFGIEERPLTKITLDKQIKQLTMTTSDGAVILDAVYDIEYELGSDDTIRSSVTLNTSLSTGYNNLASLNRTSTSQGYRYIMAESTILQGATITVQYQLMIFNVSETDTCNVILKELWDTINAAGYSGNDLDGVVEELTSPYYKFSDETSKLERLWTDQNTNYQYGTYFGSIYYLGTQGTFSEGTTMVVESTVHQIIDYVDPDVEFIDYNNIAVDQSWASVSIDDLIEYAKDGLLDPAIIQVVNSDGEPVVLDGNGNIVTVFDGSTIRRATYYNILTVNDITTSAYNTITSGINSGTYSYTVINDNLQQFITDSKNNVILSIDNGSDSGDGTNPSLVKVTVPYISDENYSNLEIVADNIDNLDFAGVINLTVSRYYSSETDATDIDNIAEIVKVENIVGRRDIRVIAGNTNTYSLVENAQGYDETIEIYQISLDEPDTSATELITLSPPTGLSPTVILILQIVGTVAVAGTIIAIGIIVIKKKVLLKK